MLSASAAPPKYYGQAIDPVLREEVQRIPVPAAATAAGAASAELVMTSYRPRGPGPFPWIVLSHGTATTAQGNRAIARYRNTPLVKEWLGRGYAVLVPVRRGYGASQDQPLADSYGSCTQPDFQAAGEGAAADLLATVAYAKNQRDLDPTRWLLVGQSSGGFASIYTASKKPAGLMAVLAFSSGRGGDPEKRPGKPCAAPQLAALFKQIAPQVAVPVLWFYAQNDQYIGPAAQKLWFDAFQRAGGRGELVVVPSFPSHLGHGVMPSVEGTALWTAAVARFFKTQSVVMPF